MSGQLLSLCFRDLLIRRMMGPTEVQIARAFSKTLSKQDRANSLASA